MSTTLPLLRAEECSNDEDGNPTKAEVRKQLRLATPLVTVNVLLFCIQTTSVMFVGHLGKLPLAGASMASSFAAVSGFSLLFGMATALDTLCGQAYGAEEHQLLGIHTLRAMVVVTAISVPIALLWACTGPILVALGQDPEISAHAGSYARWMVPSVFAYGALQCLFKFLQNQNLVLPMVACCGAAVVVHLLLCWTLVFGVGLGATGAALANNVSYWTGALLLAGYAWVSPSCKKAWTGFSWDVVFRLDELIGFLRLAVPSAMMTCLEFWAFESLVILSGLLPNPQLETSVLSISLNTGALFFMIPSGLATAASIRVSNELGAGNPKSASLAARVAKFLALSQGIVAGLIMVLLRDIWGKLYSDDEEVVSYVSTMMLILAASAIPEGVQAVLGGVAIGCGRQEIGAYVNLGAYYIVGVPSGVVMAFVFHIGGMGLRLGIMCAVLVQVVLYLIATSFTSWEKEASRARQRVSAFVQ